MAESAAAPHSGVQPHIKRLLGSSARAIVLPMVLASQTIPQMNWWPLEKVFIPFLVALAVPVPVPDSYS